MDRENWIEKALKNYKHIVEINGDIYRKCLMCGKLFKPNDWSLVIWELNPERLEDKDRISTASFCSVKCRDSFFKSFPEIAKRIVSIETFLTKEELENMIR